MWRTEYDVRGGYDMMSGAYKIISPENVAVCVIDTADMEVNNEGEWTPLTDGEARGRAKGYADLMVRALNWALIKEERTGADD